METKSNIYIVDDIQENIQVLGNILMENGFNIQIARNGEQALTGIRKKIPDLVLLDVSMPGLNGYEVCESLQADDDTREIPVIFLTARSEKADIVKGFQVGGVDYITKPFNTEELLARVKTHLELKHARDKLKELNATKDTFFRIIGHDLKGPISQMIQLAELLDHHMDDLTANDLQDLIEEMKDSSNRGFRLLENLLEWARSQSGRISFTPGQILINQLLEENIGLLQRQAKAKKITISTHLAYKELVTADANMVNTILRNLISNAIKFTFPNGKIQVHTRKENNSLIVSVQDNGKGMSADDCARLFKIDSGFSTYGTNNEKGTGIGLILCKEFVDQHQGQIWVDSAPDEGSIFSFSLPLT